MISFLFFKGCLWFWKEQTPNYFAVLQEKKKKTTKTHSDMMFFPHFSQGLYSVSSFHRVNNHHWREGALWQIPLHLSQPGAEPRWVWMLQPGGRATGSASPRLTPLQMQLWEEAATEERKQKYLPVPLLPSVTEPHSSPGHSMHWAASVAASKTFYWSLRAKPTCCLAADHGMYPGEVHSFSGPQSPSQGPPNPVRHLFPRWASGAFCQGFGSLSLTTGPPLGPGCGGGRGRTLTLSPSGLPPAAIFPLKNLHNDQCLWRCLWYGVYLVFSQAVRKEL